MAKVLLVNDDHVVAYFFRDLLERWGHEVSTAGNSVLAHLLMDKEQFDVAFVDHWLNSCGSVEVMSRAKKLGLTVVLWTQSSNVPPEIVGLFHERIPPALTAQELTDEISRLMERIHKP